MVGNLGKLAREHEPRASVKMTFLSYQKRLHVRMFL